MRYFEDIEIGKRVQAGPYEISESEIIEFATRWDPRPQHTNPEAARQTPFKGLAASEPIEKRDSESNPRAGIARTKGTLANQSGEVVLEVIATGLFAKRPA